MKPKEECHEELFDEVSSEVCFHLTFVLILILLLLHELQMTVVVVDFGGDHIVRDVESEGGCVCLNLFVCV